MHLWCLIGPYVQNYENLIGIFAQWHQKLTAYRSFKLDALPKFHLSVLFHAEIQQYI